MQKRPNPTQRRHQAKSLVSGEERRTGLTKNFTDHENQADDGGQAQPLPGNILLTLSILLCMTVVVAVLDGNSSAVQMCLHVVGNPAAHIRRLIRLLCHI